MSKKSVTIVKESVTHFAQQLAEQWLSPWSWSLGLRNCCHPCFSVLVTKFNVAQGIVYLISEEPFSQECQNDQCGHQSHCRQRYKFKASYFPWCQYWQEASRRQDPEFTTKFPTTFFSVKSRWTWEERETMWIFWPKMLRIPSIVVLRLISYRSLRAPWCSSGTQGRTCPSGRSCSCPLGNRTSRFAERENIIGLKVKTILEWKWKWDIQIASDQ